MCAFRIVAKFSRYRVSNLRWPQNDASVDPLKRCARITSRTTRSTPRNTRITSRTIRTIHIRNPPPKGGVLIGVVLMVLELILVFLGVVLVVLEVTGPQVALTQVDPTTLSLMEGETRVQMMDPQLLSLCGL